MSNEKNVTVRTGLSFSSLLAIVFITLKLLGVITWPWLWVLSPIWIPLALTLAAVAFVVVVWLVMVIGRAVKDRR
jgi:hypothetical protein